MRRIVGGLFQSLDNVVQAPGGPDEDPSGGFAYGGWAAPHADETMGAFLDDMLFGAAYDLLLGRRTYDIFAGHWPQRDDDPIGARFNRIRKYVATARPDDLPWAGSQALAGDLGAVIAALKRTDGPDLLVQGSTSLWPVLLGAGLVDRFHLVTSPIMLGAGKRWDAGGAATMRLVHHRVSPTGVVMTVYEPAGPVPTGDYSAMEEQA